MQKSFTDRDWKLFRSKLPGWQENYIDKLNHEYITLLQGTGNPSDKFWLLHKRIREDKHHAGVQLQMRRSELVFSVADLIGEGAISYEDLNEFSDDFRAAVKQLVDRRLEFSAECNE